MSPRLYRQTRRAAAAHDTRRRIVEATYQLHDEKGIAATTFRDIAARADVGLGTVYHHFPTYDHVITACGELTWERLRPPTVAIFEGLRTPEERLRRLVEEVYALYERYPNFGAHRAERSAFAALDEGFRQEEAFRRQLVERALRGVRAPRSVRALAFALLDFSTWQNLVQSGLTPRAAVDEVMATLLARLRWKGTSR